MKKILMRAGPGFIILAVVWKFWLCPGLLQRIPAGWQWQANFIGIQAVPEKAGGQFFTKESTSIYLRKAAVVADRQRPASVLIEDRFTILNPADKKVVWEYVYQADVASRTGRHLKPEWQDDYYLFPRFIEKKSYRLRNNYLRGVPLAYQKEEMVEGLTTYLFAYKGRGEYTQSYAGSTEYPGIRVEPGQEISCADDQFLFKVWVEPVPGEIIKLQESCLSGDYIHDIGTGKPLAPVLRWSGMTAGDDVAHRAEKVRGERLRLLLIGTWLPLALLTCGLVLLGWGIKEKA